MEQTLYVRKGACLIEKHLHIRGADHSQGRQGSPCRETSPHTWSRLTTFLAVSGDEGNISTYVEQTLLFRLLEPEGRKHLHIRGADALHPLPSLRILETSPHTWSRPIKLRDLGYGYGNISTYVEQTCAMPWASRLTKKHLHIRGADSDI